MLLATKGLASTAEGRWRKRTFHFAFLAGDPCWYETKQNGGHERCKLTFQNEGDDTNKGLIVFFQREKGKREWNRTILLMW